MVDFDDAARQRPPIAGCGAMALAVIVGYPLGLVVARELTGQQGLGGFVGIFVMIFVVGWLGNRASGAAARGYRLPGPLGNRNFWGAISIGFFVALVLPWGQMFPGLEWVPFPASVLVGVWLHRRDRKNAELPSFRQE
jgi:hypothetical protein